MSLIAAQPRRRRAATPNRAGRFVAWRRVSAAAGLLLLTGVATSCSQASSPPLGTGVSLVGKYNPPSCHPPAHPQVHAVPVKGVPTDWTVTSFDGTQIRAHWFPVATGAGTDTGTGAGTHPTILEGPGWGQAGDTSLSAAQLFGVPSIAMMNQAGYNVLTWDPRGFGKSTGTVELDSPNYEGRDVEELINWVATMPGVELKGPDYPSIGMVGASYGGGIQISAAAVDCRIAAIVPTIAWHSLTTSLYTADTVKSGWARVLDELGGKHIDPHIRDAAAAVTTGVLSPAEVSWFGTASPTDLVSRVNVPTLIVQGTVDNLFPLEEGVSNYLALRKRRVPVSMIWFCGGHGVCLTPTGNQQMITQATMAWLDRYVRGEEVDTGPGFRFVDQNGNAYSASSYPLAATSPITASGSGVLRLVATGGSGPAHPPTGDKDILAPIAGPITPAKAANAVNIVVEASREAVVIGAPEITLTYEGTVPAGSRPTGVFAQIVDDRTGLVLGNQIMPIDVTLDGRVHTTSVPLEIVVAALKLGDRLTLQLVATTVAYAIPRLGGSITFSHVGITLPVAAGISPS